LSIIAFFISSFRCAAVAHSLGTRSITSMTGWKRLDAQRRRRPASAEPEHLQHDGYATGFGGANDAFKLAMACASIAGE
jgi:hypothetical protein